MDFSAVVDDTSLNHVNSPRILGSIEKLATFGNILGINETNADSHPRIILMRDRE
jgi:hypothetical protein